jgi:hypothetical protein
VSSSRRGACSSRVGIVGHRVFESAGAAQFAADCCAAILRNRVESDQRPTAVSALAEGADSSFAEAALDLGLRLEVVRPFACYADDFATPEARELYERLRAAAHEEITLRFTHRSTAAYVAAMNWIVRRSQLLVAVWDGRSRRGPGGTADAVSQAVSEAREWVHIDVTRYCVTRCIGNDVVEHLPIGTGVQR